MDINRLRDNTWSVFENRREDVSCIFPGAPGTMARYRNGRFCFCLKTDRRDDFVEEFSSCRLELEDMDDGRYLVFSTDELNDAFVDMALGSFVALDNPDRRKEIASNPEVFYEEIARMLGNSFTEERVASKIAELYVFLKLREHGIKAVFGGFSKKSLHDINCGDFVIEVKSTQKHHEWPVTTNREQMATYDGGRPLYLCLVRLEPTEAYDGDVYSINNLVKSLGEFSGTDTLPNLPKNSSVRGRRFLVQDARIVQVTEDFPRPNLAGNGAKLANYTLNLDPDALGAQRFENFLEQRGTPEEVSQDDSEAVAINECSDLESEGFESCDPVSYDSESIDAGDSSLVPLTDDDIPFAVGVIVHEVFPRLQNDPRMTSDAVDRLTKENLGKKGYPVLKVFKGDFNETLDKNGLSRYYDDMRLSFYGTDYLLTSQFAPGSKKDVLEWLETRIKVSRNEVLGILQEHAAKEYERVFRAYGKDAGKIKSEDELIGEGFSLFTIDAATRGDLSECKGIGIKEDASHYRIIRLKIGSWQEALRFFAMKLYVEHRDAMRAEASKRYDERRQKGLAGLAMSVRGEMGMGEDKPVTEVFWLGKCKYGEDPWVNLNEFGSKKTEENTRAIKCLIGALVEIDNAYKREQIYFF